VRFFSVSTTEKKAKGRRHENIEDIQAAATMEFTGIPKRHSPAAFRTRRNAGNSVLTVKGTTSMGTGSISCKAEFCIFYRLSQTFTDKGCKCKGKDKKKTHTHTQRHVQ
jgi:hypothetical protein